MVFKVFLLTVTLVTFASSATKEEDFYIHNHSDDYDDYEYDEVRNGQTGPPSAQTEKPVATYEVTENVDDIPNNVTNAGPVVANFTIKPPIHIVTGANNVSDSKNNTKNKDQDGSDFFSGNIDGFEGNDKSTKDNKVNKNLRKNSISIFHVNAEFDDDKPNVQNINIDKLPGIGIFNVRDHVDRFREGIVNHIYNVHNKEVQNEVNHGFVIPNIVAGPIAFLSKLHKKGSAVASKLHNVIFGHFDDY